MYHGTEIIISKIITIGIFHYRKLVNKIFYRRFHYRAEKRITDHKIQTGRQTNRLDRTDK